MNALRSCLAFAFFVALASACSPAPHACTPGMSVACVGAAGCAGGQMCRSDGSGFDACQCGTGTDSGAGSGDAGSGDAGSTDSATSPDAAVAVDAAPDPDAATSMICDTGATSGSFACDECLGTNCCAEMTACFADPACMMCLQVMTPGCSANPSYVSSSTCMGTNCMTACAP